MFRNISTALSTSGVALESDEFTASNGFTSTSAFSPKWKKAEDYMDGIFGGIELLSEASSEEDLIQQINGFEESVVMPAAQTEEDPKKHTAGWSAEQKDAFFGKLEFLKLPPELRLCVYEQLFGLQVGKTVRQLDAYHSAEQGRVPKVYKVWDRGDGPARGESEVKVLRTCRQVYQEGTDVLYNRNYFRLTVSENFRSTYETWFDAPRVNLRTTLLGRIQNLTLEIVIWSHEQVYDWLKMRLASTQHCHFFDEMPALKTLRLSIMRQDSGNSLARSGRARSTPDIDGSASLLFWLLQAIPRDVNIVWEAHKRKVYGPGVYLSVHTLKRLAKQYTKIRGTALTIDEARREPRPDRLEEPELLKQVRSEVVKDAKKEVRREGDRRRREIARVRAGLKTFTTSTHGEYETFL